MVNKVIRTPEQQHEAYPLDRKFQQQQKYLQSICLGSERNLSKIRIDQIEVNKQTVQMELVAVHFSMSVQRGGNLHFLALFQHTMLSESGTQFK